MRPPLHYLILLALLPLAALAAEPGFPRLGQADLDWLGERIYSNECNRQTDCLLSWNAGEDFPSLGIGHFIWYRAGQQEAFVESFPDLLRFLEAQGHALPDWVPAADYEQPWPDRQAFLAAREGPRLQALARLLESSMAAQTEFIVQRFHRALQNLLQTQPAGERRRLQQRIDALLAESARLGYYALIDYVHFKGDGSQSAERYQGEGWGLLQVLQGMDDTGQGALQAFVHSAEAVLARRVALAPPERNEQRWLAGWHKRLQTYLPLQ